MYLQKKKKKKNKNITPYKWLDLETLGHDTTMT